MAHVTAVSVRVAVALARLVWQFRLQRRVAKHAHRTRLDSLRLPDYFVSTQLLPTGA